MGESDTIVMVSSLMCILLLNTFIFLYNMEPISASSFNGTTTTISDFETDLNETGVNETSSGLKAIFGIIGFFMNIFILFIGWYTSFPILVNIVIKFATYILGLTFFITLLRLIRGN